jgi:hypothetical protein
MNSDGSKKGGTLEDQSNILKCPYCGYTNPAGSVKCDCGYFFDKKEYEKYAQLRTSVEISEREERSREDPFILEKKGIQKGIFGGLIMMAIAVIWFVLAYMAGHIFYYPPILFVIGLYAFIKGIFTGNLCGIEKNSNASSGAPSSIIIRERSD